MFRIYTLALRVRLLFPAFAKQGLFPSLLASLLASVLASLLLHECQCLSLDNNSVAISLVTGLSVTCARSSPTAAHLLVTHGNLACNTPFHTPPYRRTVSVALHTRVRRDNAKRFEKNHVNRTLESVRN